MQQSLVFVKSLGGQASQCIPVTVQIWKSVAALQSWEAISLETKP